jgi:WD40 repeat protein
MFSLVATKQISGSRYLRIIGISNDGKFIATKNRDSVEIYDVKSWRVVHTLNVAGVFQASFSKSYVSTTSIDNFVRIYNLTNGEMEFKKQWKQVFTPHELKELKEMEEEGEYIPEPPIYEMKCALLSPNSEILFTQSNLPGKSEETRLHYLYENIVIPVERGYLGWDTPEHVSFSHDSKKLLCGNPGGEEFFIIDLENKKYLHEQTGILPTAVAFSPDDTKFLIGSDWETITLWNTEPCKILRTMKHDPGSFTKIKKLYSLR